MPFTVGDTVAVLDDVLKGIVVKVDATTIQVKDVDGMLYQFSPSELVKIGIAQHKMASFSESNQQLFQEKKRQPVRTKSLFVTKKKEVVMEVDLHIHQLTKSTRGMDNFDMLTLQIETAKRKLTYCIEKHIPKIVFIHGVGAGVLKTELHYLLNKYPVKYSDASYQKYGSGATEVLVFQNASTSY